MDMYKARQSKEKVSRLIGRRTNNTGSKNKSKTSIVKNECVFLQLYNLPIQRLTKILSQEGQTYTYGPGKTAETGSYVEVGLDPENMLQGQSAKLNKGQDEMMECIRKRWHIVGSDLVKGHLWNDNLGGNALNRNLYPITKAANSDHLGYVENKAKEYIFNRQPIYYRVEVDATPDINEPIAEFDCEIRKWNPKKPNEIGESLFGPITIHSDLRSVHAYNEAYVTYTGEPADRQKRPRKPKWLKAPKTKVGELSKEEWLNRQIYG